MQHSIQMSLVGILVIVMSSSRASAQSGAPPARSQCWSAAVTARVYDVADGCVSSWSDSLRSANPATSQLARDALRMTGGRAAVDALRRDFERTQTRESKLAVILAMGTTGSPEDVAFLAAQLQGAFTGVPNNGFEIQVAATTLGLLRATAARDSLQAALSRNGGDNTFARAAVAAALASLDRPPCADSVAGDLTRALERIVMRCEPQSMGKMWRYRDHAGRGIWSFSNGTWVLGPRTPADSATTSTLTNSVNIASDGRHAVVVVDTWCGPLCGEGWTFSLIRVGGTWRVVSAVMNWVS